MPGPVRVVLCDDVSMQRELLRYELEEDDDVLIVGEAADGPESVRMVRDLVPDVVVLDLAMPGLDGFEAIRLMRAIDPPPAIVVLSGFDADSMRHRAMSLGAARYLEKDGRLGAVRAAIRELTENDPGRPPA